MAYPILIRHAMNYAQEAWLDSRGGIEPHMFVKTYANDFIEISLDLTARGEEDLRLKRETLRDLLLGNYAIAYSLAMSGMIIRRDSGQPGGVALTVTYQELVHPHGLSWLSKIIDGQPEPFYPTRNSGGPIFNLFNGPDDILRSTEAGAAYFINRRF